MSEIGVQREGSRGGEARSADRPTGRRRSDRIVGVGPASQLVNDQVMAAARVDLPLLVIGPAGAGKEHIARAAHAWSNRAANPFAVVACGAVNATLIRREIFGCAAGVHPLLKEAYVGALQRADAGTVLFKNIDKLPEAVRSDLVAAIKANPGKLKASGTGQGGIWHLAIAGMLRDMKVDPASVPWVPSNGAAPGLQDLVAGGVQIAPCSLPEARSLIDAGKVKSLAVMADAPAALYPNVPTLKAATGSSWTMGAWRGMAAPKNIPPEARDKLVAAIKKIAASKDYNDFMAQRGYGVVYQGPDDFAKYMAKSDADLGATMKAVGIVK